MKQIISTLLIAVLSFGSILAHSDGDPKKLNVDSKKSSVKWIAEKVTGSHDGTVKIKEGTINVDNNIITSANIVMDMTSITVDDIEDKETNAKLLGHLKSDDFFSVSTHNTSTFTLKNFTPKKGENGNNYEISGTLNIKGISNEISFPAKINISNNVVTAVADLTFDRTKWDIRYNSGSFFDGLGDYMIYDDVKISFTLVAQ